MMTIYWAVLIRTQKNLKMERSGTWVDLQCHFWSHWDYVKRHGWQREREINNKPSRNSLKKPCKSAGILGEGKRKNNSKISKTREEDACPLPGAEFLWVLGHKHSRVQWRRWGHRNVEAGPRWGADEEKRKEKLSIVDMLGTWSSGVSLFLKTMHTVFEDVTNIS